MSIYILSLALANSLAPLICGYIIQGKYFTLAFAQVTSLIVCATGIGWRWVKGIISILSGVNFVMILFLVPESRFERDLTHVENGNATQPRGSPIDVEDPADKENALADELEVAPSPTTSSATPPKKSQMQLLNIYSGVPKDMNILELFLRPFPLIAYPAVLWATLACQLSSPEKLLSHFSDRPE